MKKIEEYKFFKGTTYLMLANLIFLLSGYGVNISAARILGPESYGIVGVIVSLMTIFSLFLTSGFPRATSKFLSENKNWGKDLIKKSIKFQVMFLTIATLFFLLISPVLAYLLNDLSLSKYIAFTVIVIPFYAVFSLYTDGFLNGYRSFKQQAISYTLFSLSKLFAIYILLIIGFEVEGVISGYIIAALIGLIIAYYFFKKISICGNKSFPAKKLIQFSLPVILFSVCMFLIFNIDLLSVKGILYENIDTGYYTSASIIARIPYFIFLGLAWSLFPSISHSTSKNDISRTREYISKSLRSMLMVLIPIILLVSATAKPLLVFLYTDSYVTAAASLEILIFGLGFLSVFNVLSHIVLGSGKTDIAIALVFFIFLLALVFNLLLIPSNGLIGAATATTIASLIGLIFMTTYVYKMYQVLMKARSFIKIIISSLILFVIAYFTQFSGFLLLLEYVVLFAFYGLILFIIGELQREDFNTIFQIIPLKIFKRD